MSRGRPLRHLSAFAFTTVDLLDRYCETHLISRDDDQQWWTCQGTLGTEEPAWEQGQSRLLHHTCRALP
jgi:hypothetical protein